MPGDNMVQTTDMGDGPIAHKLIKQEFRLLAE